VERLPHSTARARHASRETDVGSLPEASLGAVLEGDLTAVREDDPGRLVAVGGPGEGEELRRVGQQHVGVVEQTVDARPGPARVPVGVQRCAGTGRTRPCEHLGQGGGQSGDQEVRRTVHVELVIDRVRDVLRTYAAAVTP
jgi:hypothetical protein